MGSRFFVLVHYSTRKLPHDRVCSLSTLKNDFRLPLRILLRIRDPCPLPKLPATLQVGFSPQWEPDHRYTGRGTVCRSSEPTRGSDVVCGNQRIITGCLPPCHAPVVGKTKVPLECAAYSAALFSKESAPVVLLLVPLVEFWHSRRGPPKQEYCYFLLATLIWGGLFIYTAPANHHIAHGFYNFGTHTLAVLVKSLHRLAFPWLYLALLMTIRRHRFWPRDAMAVTLAWMGMALLPYVFLTYQDHVPSRNTYLASMGLVTTLGILIQTESRIRLQRTFVAAFLAVNIGYVWFVKDAQFETRAAPTSELVKELRSRSPGLLLVMDFPANPWMAKLTSRMVPGWQPESIIVNKPEETCPDCVKLLLDSKRQEYTSTTQSKPR